MLTRGKHGKPTSAFPPFPSSLNIPQQRRDIHISTAPTIRPYIKVRLKTPALKPYTWGWAKLSFRSGPSAVAKSPRGGSASRCRSRATQTLEAGCRSGTDPTRRRRHAGRDHGGNQL